MKGGVLIDLARRIFVRNFYLKFIAAILTLALYIWVSEDRETVVTGHAPVQVTVPDDLMLTSEPVDRVSVTLRGRWSDIQRFDITEIDPVTLDLSQDDDGSYVTITQELIGVPPNLRIIDVEPDSIYVELQPEAFRTVPVEPRVTGSPRSSYTVEDQRVIPETVTIRGPEDRLEQLESVPTEPIDITGRTRPLEREIRPQIDDALITVEDERPITLHVDIGTEEITETLQDLPVESVNTTYDTTIEPPSADVIVEGPRTVIEQMDRELIRVEIDLSEEDDLPPDTYSRGGRVINLPRGVEVLDVHPERFRVTTEEVDEQDEQTDSDNADL